LNNNEFFKSDDGLIISPVDDSEHTMGENLKGYVKSKFDAKQTTMIQDALVEGYAIEVHACYDNHFRNWLRENNWKISKEKEKEGRKNKIFSGLRPIFFLCESEEKGMKLFVSVFPSKEYSLQYAELISQLLSYYNEEKSFEKHCSEYAGVKLFYYPGASENVVNWTGFEKNIKKILIPDDIVVIGEVSVVAKWLEDWGWIKDVDNRRFGIDDIFGYSIYEHPSTRKRLILLGSKHSFWGETSGRFAAALARCGMGHLIYTAKAGTFQGTATDKQFVHSFVCPNSEYILLEYDDQREYGVQSYKVTSSIHEKYPGLIHRSASGSHLTVPTVVGETIKQRKKIDQYTPSSVDNEVSFIAKHLSEYNNTTSHKVELTVLHFITDYIYRDGEEFDSDLGNLSNKVAENESLRNAKQDTLADISSIISTYAMHNGASNVSCVPFLSIGEIVNKWLEYKAYWEKVVRGDINPSTNSSASISLLNGIWGADYNNDKLDFRNIVQRVLKKYEGAKKSYSLCYAARLCIQACKSYEMVDKTRELDYEVNESEREARSIIDNLNTLEKEIEEVIKNKSDGLSSSHSKFIYHKAVLNDIYGYTCYRNKECSRLIGEKTISVLEESVNRYRVAWDLYENEEFESSENANLWKAFLLKIWGGALFYLHGEHHVEAKEKWIDSEKMWDSLVQEYYGGPESECPLFLEIEHCLSRVFLLEHGYKEYEKEWIESICRVLGKNKQYDYAYSKLDKFISEYEKKTFS